MYAQTATSNDIIVFSSFILLGINYHTVNKYRLIYTVMEFFCLHCKELDDSVVHASLHMWHDQFLFVSSAWLLWFFSANLQ